MSARVIDGKSIAAELRGKIAREVARVAAQGVVPGIAVVLVGEDPASGVYVRTKSKAVAEAGMRAIDRKLPASTGESELLELIAELNADRQVNGILVQLPLPRIFRKWPPFRATPRGCQGALALPRGTPFPQAPKRLFVTGAAPRESAMNPFLWLVDTIITIYIWLLIGSAVLSWLIAFNVVNTRNPIVHSIGDFLYRITEPLLRPIRNMLPNLGGIDVSPVILIIGLLFLRQLIFWLYIRLFL